MPELPTCPDDIFILQNKFCLNEVTKNIKGTIKLTDNRIQKCEKPACVTLIATHNLSVKITAQRPCDATKALDGTLEIVRLATAFNKDGLGRGIHAGNFVWKFPTGQVAGKITGVTNPAKRPASREEKVICAEPGVMVGQLCGTIKSKDNELNGCQVTASYRIQFKGNTKGGEGTVKGTLDGALICQCAG